jgi:FMN reductase
VDIVANLRLVALSGSTSGASRTTRLVETIAASAARRRGFRVTLLELRDLAPGLMALRREDLGTGVRHALDAIEEADVLVVGTPVYKGSYPGLFKHLIDFVDPLALTGRPVALAATGGGRRHALAVEHQLRPLFGFFSALVLPTTVYASDEDFTGGALTDPVTLARIEQLAGEIGTFASARPRAEAPALLERVA